MPQTKVKQIKQITMAIKKSEVAEVLRNKLHEGETRFVFIKKDGSRRPSVGTLNLDLIPDVNKQFKHQEGEREERTDQTSYFDMEKLAWRCCKYDKIVEIEGEEVEEDRT